MLIRDRYDKSFDAGAVFICIFYNLSCDKLSTLLFSFIFSMFSFPAAFQIQLKILFNLWSECKAFICNNAVLQSPSLFTAGKYDLALLPVALFSLNAFWWIPSIEVCTLSKLSFTKWWQLVLTLSYVRAQYDLLWTITQDYYLFVYFTVLSPSIFIFKMLTALVAGKLTDCIFCCER